MRDRPIYKRILIKLSGEVMTAQRGMGIDPVTLRNLAKEIKDLRELGIEIALVIGGGNLIRGAQATEYGITRVTADQVGMLTTIINALAFRDVLEEMEIPTSLQSALPIEGIVAPYVCAHALRDLREQKVVIFAGGIGSPFFTTDTAASLRALEIGAEIILKATKVDGVYDSDPVKNPAAVKFDRISYQEVLQRRLRVMDSTAISLCMDNQIPLVVFNIGVRENMKRIVLGKKEGTLIGG
ncbi:MAG: UMP kinase [Deltaproteobacteria bacterium]|nr:MAG: UMP kinase [Deltaproteobacteria bacterium]